MKVSDLAAELGVPSSAVLEQCQRFSIDAAWAGAELNGADVVILRAELADADDALDLTPADEPAEAEAEMATDAGPEEPTETAPADVAPVDVEEPVEEAAPIDDPPAAEGTDEPEAVDEPADPAPAPAAATAAAGLPPTAVGSMPDLIDEVTPEPTPETEPAPTGGLRTGGLTNGAGPNNGPRRIAPREAPATRKLDRSARNAPIFLVIAIGLFVGSNYVDNVFAITALWLMCLLALIGALVDGIRGRRHIQVHPEHLYGTPIAIISVVFAIAGMIGLSTAVATVLREQPAADVPMNVGDLSSVQSARWGYQRVTRLKENGWTAPAREAGSCWRDNLKTDREAERVEVTDGGRQVRCELDHTIEVAKVFAADRNADSPYPGSDKFQELALQKCGPTLVRIETKSGVNITLKPEYPTQAGWDDGDHDVACLFVTDMRKDPLT